MSTSFQFGRSWRDGWFLGLLALTVGLVVAVSGWGVVRRELQIWLLLGAVAGVFSVVMSLVLIRRSRFQLEVQEHGFLIRDRQGERVFADDQVLCAGLDYRHNFSNGLLRSTTRVFDLWVEGHEHTEHVLLSSQLPAAGPDPLAGLIDRIQNGLFERAVASLAAGEQFEGEGWTLSASELALGAGQRRQAVDLSALSAVGQHDGQLCVWQQGQDLPVLRIPVGSANTRVLQRLLEQRIVPGLPEPDTQRQHLGRVLFERLPVRGSRWLIWLLPVLAGLSGLAAVGLAVVRVRGIPVAGLVLGGVLLIVWLILLAQAVEFQFCESGIRRRWLFRISELRWDEVDSLTYSAIRQYVKGAYVGTHLSLTLATTGGGRLVKMRYAKTLRHPDMELEQLRDRISEQIASRMQEEYVRTGSVTWTTHLRFLREGLEYRAASLIGRRATVLIPYSQIYGYDADAGIFNLWVHGRKKPLARENVNLPNFFPGYFLLVRLLDSRPSGTETHVNS